MEREEMRDFFLDVQIFLARRSMVAGYRVARWSSAWLTSLCLSRSPESIERMERKKGLQ